MDRAVFPAGDYAVSLDGDDVVGSMELGAGVALSLPVPADGAAVPLTVFGGVTADAGARLVVASATAFGKQHPGERVTLMECEKDSAAALETLAANLSFANTGRCRQGTVAVVDGVKLVYTAPPDPGMTISFR